MSNEQQRSSTIGFFMSSNLASNADSRLTIIRVNVQQFAKGAVGIMQVPIQ
jgi:hypothetical protein